jgi:hypothetical protein
MRFGWLIAVLLLSACAVGKLALTPAPGIDFSGQWRLNDADSDDPQRVAMSQSAAQSNSQNSTTPGGPAGGRGRSRGAPGMAGGSVGPAVPAVGALRDGLHWPGKEVEITQRGGVVTLVSGGFTQVYEPARSRTSAGREKATDPRGDGPPPVCGWDDKTLVIKTDAPNDEDPPFEQRYSLSADGRRLIEVVAFEGGRSSGFTVSRVWDKVQ